LVLKIIKLNKNGFPDLLALKENETMFIEVKRPTGKLSELQKIRIEQLRAKGITTKIWTEYDCNFEY